MPACERSANNALSNASCVSSPPKPASNPALWLKSRASYKASCPVGLAACPRAMRSEMSRSSSLALFDFLPATSSRRSRSTSRRRSFRISWRFARSAASSGASPSFASDDAKAARWARDFAASSRNCCSRSSSSCAFLCVRMALRIFISSRALRSATNSASDRPANLSLTVLSCKPRPSAATRLSSGTVYPCLFFQFDTHGGIFHDFWSAAVSFRGGECCTGGGGVGGPRGIRVCLWRGGSKGSRGISWIRMMRCAQPALCPGACWFGVNRTNCGALVSAFWIAPLLSFLPRAASSAALVRSVFNTSRSSPGFSSSSELDHLAF
mmetsp:Transcript_78077/g.208743  ORF Transcript_78077/g.208743 Transcript_78077/m.208743 type:complete len:324 (+) Transcript_78077:266-1237(+)